jgi:Raf kinase inhibitor-like YbhB/YbcL family protein
MPQHSSGEAITIEKIAPQTPDRIEVKSAAFKDGAAIPAAHSEYGDGVSRSLSPPLTWTKYPDAKAYALIVEDPDAPMPHPVVHWIAWNIPPQITSLPQGVHDAPKLDTPEGMLQGRNVAGKHGYYGMKPPDGDGAHRYHFQLFALSEPIAMGPEAPFVEIVDALKARVLAEGELIGTFERRTQ